MSKRHTLSIIFALTSLLVMSISSICFADGCDYTALADEDGNRHMIPADAGCAPDCPEDTVIRYNFFTHQFSCSTDTEKHFDSIALRKIKPVVRTTTYSY